MTEDISAPVANGFEEKAREIVDAWLEANAGVALSGELVSAIASALSETDTKARLQEREECAEIFKQRLEGLENLAQNRIHDDGTWLDIRQKSRKEVAEELLTWLSLAIRSRS